MIKLVMGMMVCGSMVACGGATRVPVASVGALQTCEGGVARSDAELVPFRRCALIEGDLAVSGVTSLAPLSQLRAVSGTLSVANTAVEGLGDLGSVASVGRLEVRDNSQLSSLAGLSHLGKARELVIQGNSQLRTLHGLSGLRELGRLSIQGTSLYSLNGVDNLSEVNELDLVGNLELIDPRALNQVQHASSVVIRQNPRLCAQFGLLAGLEHAERVSFSQNVALDRSAVQRLVDSRVQTTVASR
ncbi:MAG TPA: hypothetical protein VFK05_25345 [Polyangiaceae bacterium]|nr:hypothetical protein [Polyangiaceae bacterium]